MNLSATLRTMVSPPAAAVVFSDAITTRDVAEMYLKGVSQPQSTNGGEMQAHCDLSKLTSKRDMNRKRASRQSRQGFDAI